MNTISAQVKQQRDKLREQGRKYAGLRVILEGGGPAEVFPAGFRRIREVLSNLDQLDPSAFEVSTNPLDEVKVIQVKWVPNFYLL